MKKIIKVLLLLIILFLVDNNIVNAEVKNHIIDFDKKGSIEIVLKDFDETNKIEGAEIALYYVASVSSENNQLIYKYVESLNDCNGNLDDLTNPSLVNDVNKCIINKEISNSTKITNKDGIVKFEELNLGLYLVMQTNDVQGYSKIEPFLISIPENLDNKWNYDIEAEPKTDIIRLMDVIVEKKWDISKSRSTPESVTIELLKDNEVIDTVTLSQDNQWTHTWNQIEESDGYSVREKVVPEGYTVIYRQEGNKFIVTNIRTLVDTGQNYSICFILAGIGLLIIIFGIIYDRKNKYE